MFKMMMMMIVTHQRRTWRFFSTAGTQCNTPRRNGQAEWAWKILGW